jgi:hypothetical protein
MAGLADKLRQLLGAGMPAKPGQEKEAQVVRKAVRRTSGPRWAEPVADHFADPAATPKSSRALRSRTPFVTSYYVWGTLALLAAGASIGVLTLKIVQDDGMPQATSGTGLADPLQSLEPTSRENLLRQSPELSAELKRSFLGKPDALCEELRELGLENAGWRKAPFKTDRWQCASDLVLLTTPSVDFGATTLFFLLRGSSEDRVDYLRLKLVVEDPRQKTIGLEAVWLVIDALAGRYGWTVPDAFRKAVSDFDQLETVHHGVRLSVAPEDPDLTGDPLASGRLNIIMNFGEPDLIRPADRFEKAPPLESGWSVRDPDAREGE